MKVTDLAVLSAELARGVVIVSPGGRTGQGGIATVTRAMADGISGGRNKVPVHVVDSRGRGTAWAWPLFFARAFWKIALLRSLNSADILHLQVSERSSFIRKGLLLILGQTLRMKVVLHHHGAELIPFYRSTSRPMRAWTRWVILKVDINIVLGERWASFLRDEIGVRPEKIRLMYNASLDLRPAVEAARERDQHSNREASIHAVVMAHLAPRKGIGEFLRAIQQLRQQGYPVRATLAGVGDVEGYTREARNLGLAGCVNFPGWIDHTEIPTLLASADMLVLPSYEEGLPMAILEALSCEVPVVATPVGSIPDVLTDGLDCLFVHPGDHDGLAQAIGRLIDNKALRRSLALNGRAAFDRTFNLHLYLETMTRLYTEVLKDSH